MTNPNRYERIIQHIFNQKFRPGDLEVAFSRDDVIAAARTLAIEPPRNLGDVIYSFRRRTALPADVNAKAPDATPGLISRYVLNDGQSLLAKIRYNRLIDRLHRRRLLLAAKSPAYHRAGRRTSGNGRDLHRR